jgi:hypothetical protein
MPQYLGPACAGCGVVSPVTNTNYTRVSLSGWRSIRTRRAHPGRSGASHTIVHWTIEWRCRTCWLLYKARGGLARARARERPQLGDPASPGSSPVARP